MKDLPKSFWLGFDPHEEFGQVRAIKFREVMEKGEDWYDAILMPYRVNKQYLNLEDSELTNFDIVIGNPNLLESFICSLECFYEGSILGFNEERTSFTINGVSEDNQTIEIDRKNFDKFREFILEVNGTSPVVREIVDIPEEFREQYEEMKRCQREYEERERPTLSYIAMMIRIYSKGSISKSEILDYPVYELLTVYKFLSSQESFEINFKQALAGADTKKLDLKHWSTK